MFVLFIVFGFFVGQDQNRKEQELAIRLAQEKSEKVALLQQKNIDYFNANREQIILAANKAFSEKDYQSVISQTNKYLVAGDKELLQINSKAKDELASIEKVKKTKKLLAELKNVPAQEYEKNKNLYQQLSRMHPDNVLYKEKITFYTGKIEEEKQKQIAAEARKKKIEAQFSTWDGSHHNLERIIKESMNDPDSYDHVETVYWDSGDYLIVRTTFRGKNAFGGVVKNSVKAKVSIDGQVLQILEQY